MSRLELNYDIVTRNLDRNTKAIMEEVKLNVNEAVDDVIKDFQDAMLARAEKFENGGYDAELNAATAAVEKDLESKMTGLQTKLKGVHTAAEKAEKAASKAGGEELKQEAEALAKATASLEEELDTFEKQIKDFGSKAGRLVSSTLTKGIFGS